MRPAPDPDDGWDCDDDEPTTPSPLEVDVTDPEILGELYGPDGELIAYLVDRRPIPFGFQPGGT